MNKILILIGIICIMSSHLFFTSFANISGSSHDFSTSGWSGGKICIVCHTPHNSDTSITNAPLWNHQITTQTFIVYVGYDMNGLPASPITGISKLCLSCHDGVTAIDNYGGVTSGTTTITNSRNLGTNLTDDHPIAFTYDTALALADGELWDPATKTTALGGTITNDLLISGKLTCASCHDVHNKAGNLSLLTINNAASALCLTCHDK